MTNKLNYTISIMGTKGSELETHEAHIQGQGDFDMTPEILGRNLSACIDDVSMSPTPCYHLYPAKQYIMALTAKSETTNERQGKTVLVVPIGSPLSDDAIAKIQAIVDADIIPTII